MAKGGFGKVAATVALAAVCAFGVTACGGGSASSGSAAATVNGTTIPEQEVTDYIEGLRAQIGCSDAESWANYLNMIGMTPEQVRTNILDSMINQELIKQYAGEKGVEVKAEDVQYYVDMMRSNFGSDEEWAKALEDAGLTEESYRESIEGSLRSQALNAIFEQEVQVPEEELLATAKNYSTYIDGSKRSSHILFSLDDREQAQSVLNRIKAGELDFVEAAKEYSIDSSGANGGDVGWDSMSTFVSEYQSALDALEVGQISDLVESQYGYHIIMCTEHFVAPEEITSLDQIPEGFRDTIREAASATAVQDMYQAWLDEMREKANVVVNAMPEKAPYNVSVAAQESASAESASASAAASSASASSGAAK